MEEINFIAFFSEKEEEKLVNYLLSMANNLFDSNNLNHRRYSDMTLAGKDWVKFNLARHPSLIIRES